MGVQGLKRLLQEKFSKCSHYVNTSREKADFDHVLLDMNSILHSCVTNKSTSETLKDVIYQLEKILVITNPQQTLIITIDGPAPIAKIPLQRGRRKSSALTIQPSQNVTKIDITPGTQFMAVLTSTLTAWAAKLVVKRNIIVKVSGDNVAGEGEVKIFEEVQEIIKRKIHETKQDAVNEQFCIIGNDSDLVLGAVCMTRAVNFTVLNPLTGESFAIGDLISSWLGRVAGMPMKFFAHDTTHLPALRLSFAFTQMTAGNDYLPAIQGVDASTLWLAISENFNSLSTICSLVDMTNFSIINQNLAKLLTTALVLKAKPQPTGREDTTNVLSYLQGLAWSMLSLCGFGCSDYTYVYEGGEVGVHINSIITYLNQTKKNVKAPTSSVKPPVPAKYLACVMPTQAWWLINEAIYKQVREDVGKKRKRQDTELEMSLMRLAGTSDAAEIVQLVDSILKICGSDKGYRFSFNLPVSVSKNTTATKKAHVLKPPTTVPKMTPADWHAVTVQPLHPETFRPYFPPTQMQTQMMNTNPFTKDSLEIPLPKKGSKKKKKEEVKTGVQLLPCLSMDEEV